MNPPELIPCPTHGDDVRIEDMCWCREPICWECHYDGGHHVPEGPSAA